LLVSVIVPTYKDTEALKLVLEALNLQTYKEFEVVIAEDDNSKEVGKLLENYEAIYEIKHFSQNDDGWRKAKALNGAIEISKGKYIIFFDGDCLPYSTFIESHVVLSEENRVLCGRRVNTGNQLTQALRDRKISVNKIENNFLSFWSKFKQDGARHIEQGLYLFPNSSFYRRIIKLLDKKKRLVGCNFSAFKKDLIAINGFDESYPSGDVADDVDVEWRLNRIGVENKSCKYAANLIHLNHPRKDRRVAHAQNYKSMQERQKKDIFFCLDGLIKY
jgi:cellulose synthase/poly-beta-1,6-N-acetylglucosamine synthase-like glycosyltransferase